ncbi:hypothetical protein SAMN05428949_7214 [Chitinophaga sp. YR627]|nr:hypothetical protein SAMN05428949_7214 [Chitinophaga sp. YR627]
MRTIDLNKQERTRQKSMFTIDYNMRDYSDDPVFVKKKAHAQASLAKWGIPKDL